MITCMMVYVLLGMVTLAVGELTGESLLKSQAEHAALGSDNKIAQAVGVAFGVATAILLWPPYALGMFLQYLGRKK